MMVKNRPNSIIWFERLFFASFAISFIDMFVHRDLLFGEDEFSAEFGLVLWMAIAGGALVGYGIQISLWFFVVYRAANWARWIYAILWVLSVSAILSTFLSELTASEIIFMALAQLCGLGSVICLFTSQARFWFSTKARLPEGKDEQLSDIFQ